MHEDAAADTGQPPEQVDDDWAPLSPEQLALRPGEVAPAPEVVAVAAKQTAPLPLRPRRPASAEGKRALAELQQRLLAMPPGDSMVAEMQRREQRQARRQRGAAQVGEQLAATVVDDTAPRPEVVVVPELEIDERGSEVDARELEPWFRELPESERERLRAQWHANRHRYDDSSAAARSRLLRAAAYGAGCFLCIGVLMIFLTGLIWQVPIYVAVGAVAGTLAQLCGGGRFLFSAGGALGFVAVQGQNLLSNPFCLYGLLLSISAMAAIGLDGEMRRSAGCRDD